MIPSSPRRTWIFLIASTLVFFGPDLVVPEAMAEDPLYLRLYGLYQGVLIVLFFWSGPALCRAMVVAEVAAGPLRTALDQTRASLGGLPDLPITLVGHDAPFILTAGLLPSRSAVFLSTAQIEPMGPLGLRFLLARALAHGGPGQRLAAVLPILLLTLLWPDDYGDPATWLFLAGFSAAWLAVHWGFELHADRRAARAMGAGAELGLAEMLAVGVPAAMSLQPPLRWRLRAVVAA